MGALLTGLLARTYANPNLAANLSGFVTNKISQPLAFEQLKAMGVTLGMAVVGTVVIAFVVRAILGLRLTAEEEMQGLDIVDHGEEGYVSAAEVAGSGFGHGHGH